MGSAEKFCLRWNDFDSNIRNTFEELRRQEEFCDVSLCCDGFGEPNAPERLLKAHKVVLSACSPFFRDVLLRLQHGSSQMHPVVYLRGVKRGDLRHILDFMYYGEVNVAQEDLTSFLAVAEDLKIKGLTNNDHSKESRGQHGGTTVKAAKHKMEPMEMSASRRAANNVKRARPNVAKASTSADVSSAVSNLGDDDDDIQIEEVSVVKKEDSENKLLVECGVDQFQQGGDEDYEDYGQYEGEEGDEDFSGVPLDETGEGTSDGTKDVRLSGDDPLLRDMIATKMLPTSSGFLCLLCHSVISRKTHVKRHLLDRHVPTNTNFVCPVCGKAYRNRSSFGTHVYRYHREQSKTIDFALCERPLSAAELKETA